MQFCETGKAALCNTHHGQSREVQDFLRIMNQTWRLRRWRFKPIAAA
jgi:hypothetical protein